MVRIRERCENFLYVFKAARWAARAADAAASPALPLALLRRRAKQPVDWRETQRPRGRLWCTEVLHVQAVGRQAGLGSYREHGLPNLALSGTTRTRQGRLRRPFGQTLDRTWPTVAEIAAIGSRGMGVGPLRDSWVAATAGTACCSKSAAPANWHSRDVTERIGATIRRDRAGRDGDLQGGILLPKLTVRSPFWVFTGTSEPDS